MVCAMAGVASAENILDVIKQTEGVGKELFSHIKELLSVRRNEVIGSVLK